MAVDPELSPRASSSKQPAWRRVIRWPSTQLGWAAVGLAAVFELMMIVNNAVFMRLPEDVPWRTTVLPYYGIFMMLCGLAAGIVGLIAVVRRREPSLLVWLTVLIGVSTLVFVVGEFLVPH